MCPHPSMDIPLTPRRILIRVARSLVLKMRHKLLIFDAVINFTLGILLLLSIPYSDQITGFLGVPGIEQAFYPSIMGGVFMGIGVSLVIESNRRNPGKAVGLGLAGAVTINLCGGVVLIGWLLFGDLNLPTRGMVFLWVVAVLLVGISSIEALAQKWVDDH